MNNFVENPATKKSLARRKRVFGVGINDATYMVRNKINGVRRSCPYYAVWTRMLERCYCPKYQERRPTYIGCTVDPAWLTFSVFRKWMKEQPWEGNQLDKDLTLPGNKEYSPENCCFISSQLNSVLNDCGASKGRWPQGVSYHKRNKKLQAHCCGHLPSGHIGNFDTPEAAHQAYLKVKTEILLEYAKQQADPRIKAGLKKHADKLQAAVGG